MSKKITVADLAIIVENQAKEIEALNTIIDELKNRMDELSSIPQRTKMPKSMRKMDNMDAWRVLYGDLSTISTKECASLLGLSYGQIYSARGNYTFLNVKEDDFSIDDIEESNKAAIDEDME